MRIMLTGATGFIGRYVLRFLLDAGQRVNVLVRDPSKVPESGQASLKVFAGDIGDREAVSASMRGCDIVIHLAALVGCSAETPSAFVTTNLRATENLLQAAERYHVSKFIFASSLSAHCYAPTPVLTEESLQRPERFFSLYAETKARAEELVLEYALNGLPSVIVYPARVFGIGPLTDANGATKAISLYLRNKLPFLVEGGKQYSSWAFVDDVARGIISAAACGASRQRYFLGGENRTLAEVYRMADEISGRNHLRISLKNTTALLIASALELHARLCRRKPLITREWLVYIMESQKISSAKAIAELHYTITPLETALPEPSIGLRRCELPADKNVVGLCRWLRGTSPS